MSAALSPETELVFPSQTIVTASAGSGKTYTLSWRFVQYLLSAAIPKNKLWNLLAVTFTKNAAAEMKQRILQHLKHICLGDADALAQASALVPLPEDVLRKRASDTMDLLLHGYADFQVQTIDSFLERIFRSSTLDLALPPDFQVELSSGRLFADAFAEYTKRIKEGSPELAGLLGILDSYESYRSSSSRFLWKPTGHIRERARDLHDYLVTLDKPVERYNAGAEIGRINTEFIAGLRAMREAALGTGFELTHHFVNLFEKAVSGGGIADTIGKKSLIDPLKKGKHSEEEKSSVLALLEPHLASLQSLQRQYVIAEARGSFSPALASIDTIGAILDDIKWREARVLIQDVSVSLNGYIRRQNIPEVYFRLGEQIAHFFIDEFQDTSPVQWSVMRPLIEHALAEQGSLFVVGDPKQSINLFRGADWQIMIDLAAKNDFPSAAHIPTTLDTNYRSGEVIVDYSRDLFCERSTDDDRLAAALSGLDAFEQKAKPSMRGKGYVELVSIPALQEEEEDEATAADGLPEEEAVIRIIKDCRTRGFAYRDIGILASKNAEIVLCGQWLNKHGIPFVSYSSLDVRHRKIAGEVFSMLSFLDSPIDDFAFGTVLLGEIFDRWSATVEGAPHRDAIRSFMAAHAQRERPKPPLYKAFAARFPAAFEAAFERLLAVAGYLPTYDILTQVYSILNVFELFPDEESALAKLLESTAEASGDGAVGLKGFLALVEDDSADSELWSMRIPDTLDAVQVMTIHKAKGLEFPAGIVLLYDHDAPRPDYYLEDAGEQYRLLRLRKNSGDLVPEYRDLYERQTLKLRADTLNRLYVALTRPRLELYVVNIFKERSSTMPSPLLQAGTQLAGQKEQAYASKTASVEEAPRRHAQAPRIKEVRKRGLIQGDDSDRGTWLHAILAGMEFTDSDIAAQIAAIAGRLNLDLPPRLDLLKLADDAAAFFAHAEFKAWFERREGREVFRELDIVGADGRLNRIDRIVKDGKDIAVIDFKTGLVPDDENYARQLGRYIDAVKGVFPETTVTGYIAYLDMGQVKEVLP